MAGATQTAAPGATGTAAAYATSTALATLNPTAAATSDATLQPFQQTCQVSTGTQVDTTTGQQCNEFFGQTLEYRSGQWWPVATYCMTNAQCKTGEGTNLGSYPELPCYFDVSPAGIVVDCSKSTNDSHGLLQTWNVRAGTQTTCPDNEVLRAPYPRTLVNLKTSFVLQPKEFNDENGNSSGPQSPANLTDFIDAHGNPTPQGYDIKVWKNLQLIMRSKRFNGGETWFGDAVPYPKWEFNDRAWNPGKFPQVQQDGPTANYLYETSSANLPTKLGRAFDIVNKVPANDFTLPAYPVQLTTFCGHEWMVTVDLPTKYWNKTGACYNTILYPDGTTYEPPGTNHADCPKGQVAPGDWKYGWTNFQTGHPGSNGKWQWDGIDLKKMGWPVSYASRTKTKAGGVFKDPTTGTARVYWDDPWGIWVPVVEVQSTIRDQCVFDGTCEPIGAEAGSLNNP